MRYGMRLSIQPLRKTSNPNQKQIPAPECARKKQRKNLQRRGAELQSHPPSESSLCQRPNHRLARGGLWSDVSTAKSGVGQRTGQGATLRLTRICGTCTRLSKTHMMRLTGLNFAEASRSLSSENSRRYNDSIPTNKDKK
jgi:hypothetical protein